MAYDPQHSAEWGVRNAEFGMRNWEGMDAVLIGNVRGHGAWGPDVVISRNFVL